MGLLRKEFINITWLFLSISWFLKHTVIRYSFYVVSQIHCKYEKNNIMLGFEFLVKQPPGYSNKLKTTIL